MRRIELKQNDSLCLTEDEVIIYLWPVVKDQNLTIEDDFMNNNRNFDYKISGSCISVPLCATESTCYSISENGKEHKLHILENIIGFGCYELFLLSGTQKILLIKFKNRVSSVSHPLMFTSGNLYK